MNTKLNEFRVSNDVLGDAAALQHRMHEDGYLFIKKLQDPDKLLALRQEIMQVIMNGGWLIKGTDPMDGLADITKQCTEGDIEYPTVYHEMYKLEAFHRAGHWPEMMAMMEKVIGGPVLSHPQKIARLWFPKYTAHTTPVHQDFVHFQGVYDTYTCWAPIGDCPADLGGLAVLPGSHKVNAVHEHHFSLGAGGLAIHQEELENDWVTTDYECGDTLIFHSLTVHQALPNVTENRLRLSLDNRYQSTSLPIAEHMLNPHLGRIHPLSWDEVYRDWKFTDLQHYWKHLNLEILPTIEAFGAKGFEEALERAGQGDDHAILALKRVIKLDPNGERGQQAVAVLEML
jgi:hypothetical protein